MSDDKGQIYVVDLWKRPMQPKTESSDVKFYLYNKKNKFIPEEIPANASDIILQSPNFNKNKKVLFIIHGWQNDHTSPVNTLIKSAVLDRYDINVFVVGWGIAASYYYPTARYAVPDVGRIVGEFINKIMKELQVPASNIYMAGHSLGAHVCGKAGEIATEKIRVIVGMDPALPIFTMDELEERLDTTDAEFVHIIHTNAGLLGFSDSIGNADYYPNGGNTQPGCWFDVIGTCAHSRSYEYFSESIKSGEFKAVSCESYESFTQGLCNDNKVSLLGHFEVDFR